MDFIKSQNSNFLLFVFGRNRPTKNISIYFTYNKLFIDYKNHGFYIVEKFEFFHAFGQKLESFPSFHFRQGGPRKCVSRFSRKKKRLTSLKKIKKFKNSQNWDFSKGVSPWLWSETGNFPSLYFRQKSPEKYVSRYSI